MIKPIQDFILIRPIEKEQKSSVIIVSKAIKPEPTQQAIVIALGPGKQTPITSVKEGDTIVIPHYAGIEVIDEDGNKLVLIRVTDILAVIQN